METVTMSTILSNALPAIKEAVVGAWGIVTETPLGIFFVGCVIASVGFGYLAKASRGV